jgi:hypothetical protein
MHETLAGYTHGGFMINVETLEDNIIKLQVTGTLEESDFHKISTSVDQLINAHGTIKLLIDATEFNGWANTEAAKTHFTFVRDHQKKIDQVALVAGHEWQHWIVVIASVFVHPEVKAFDKDGIIQAESWLLGKKKAA